MTYWQNLTIANHIYNSSEDIVENLGTGSSESLRAERQATKKARMLGIGKTKSENSNADSLTTKDNHGVQGNDGGKHQTSKNKAVLRRPRRSASLMNRVRTTCGKIS